MRISTIALALVIAIAAFSITACDSSSAPPAGVPPNSSNLPSELTSVNPVNAAVVCPREQVRVDLSLTDATRHNGAFDISTVSLVLDGNDVMKTANVLGTLELPQGRASFSYAPATPMSAGLHRVSFTFATSSQPKVYAWMFNVADKPC